MADWTVLQREIGIVFNDESVLQQAFVHRSYLNENPESNLQSNERLEFLGDALLGFVVAERLFQQYGDLTEGDMTKIRAALVSRDSLAEIAFSYDLGEYLYLGQGEEKSGGRKKPRNLACLMEALIGAVFIDGSYSIARDLIWRLLDEKLQTIMVAGLETDYKTKLQEVTQGGQRGTPSYRVVEAAGPNHDKKFRVEVLVEGVVLGIGTGRSKQAAEKEAARQALDQLTR